MLASNPDVVATYNHNQSVILGRTTSGTLQLRSDANGLRFDCDLPDTQAARDVHTLVERGDLNACSFAFSAPTKNGPTRRKTRTTETVAQAALRCGTSPTSTS